MSNQDQPIHVK